MTSITLLEVLRVPPVPLPLYPPFSRVVMDRVPLLQGGDAYLGPVPPFTMTPVQIQDVAFLRHFLEPICFSLLFLSIIGAMDVWQRKRSDLQRREVFCWAALLVAGACVWHTSFMPSFISQLGPLCTLPRLFPGLVYVPLLYPAIAVSVFCISLLLRAARGYDLLGMIALLLFIPLQWQEWRVSPHAQRADGAGAWAELLSKDLPTEVRAWREDVLLSPSYWLVREKSPHFFESYPRRKRDFDLVAISKFAFSATAFREGRQLQDLLRSKAGGRWSSGSGSQNGGEWIHLRFDEPISMSAVRLDLGSYPTDFPRGLEAHYAPECDEPASADFADYKMIFKRAKWEGEVAYTENGYPYLEPEANVLAAFDEPVRVKCLVLKQTGTSPNFEWSVTGIHVGQQK